jgi:O-antigen/teichoic acid export membrane protein
LSDVPIIDPDLLEPAPEPSRGFARTVSKNVAISLARVAVNSLVALVLPAYLTHHLPVTTYGAWVLVLQLSAYVSFLDFGVQTGVAKFVAEFDAKGDRAEAGRHASAGLAMMSIAALLGFALTLALAWQVPRLFHDMPPSLYRDVRISVVLIGSSLSFGLICSVFSAIFLGVQRYSVPMAISIANRILFTAAVLVAVLLHGTFAMMGAAVALINVSTALLQLVAWRRMVSHIRVSLALVDRQVLNQMTRYCFLFSVWTVGMMCVSGLDVIIVGHYDFGQTAYYSIATLPVNFVLLIVSSMLGPLMPASSALSTQRSAAEMGNLLARTTRYCTMFLLLTGLPLMVCGFPILRLWVGPVYALASIRYLRILVLANILRSICAPYATLLSATGRQGAASITAISEAVVNLGSSIYFASRFGAIGVAYGTLLGAVVSIALHFAVTMHLTRQTLAISRMKLFLKGVSRPTVVAVPSVLLLPLWWASSRMAPSGAMTVLWALSTLLLAWFGNLDREEQRRVVRFARRRAALLGSG